MVSLVLVDKQKKTTRWLAFLFVGGGSGNCTGRLNNFFRCVNKASEQSLIVTGEC